MLTPDDIQQFTKALGALDLTIREHTVALKEHTAALTASAPVGGGVGGSAPAARSYLSPTPKTAATKFTGAWAEFEIPFGKQAGRTLGSLPSSSLTWWIESYQPKDYNGNPPRSSDLAFRAALDAAKAGGGVSALAPSVTKPSDLPLEKEQNLVNKNGTSSAPVAAEDVPF